MVVGTCLAESVKVGLNAVPDTAPETARVRVLAVCRAGRSITQSTPTASTVALDTASRKESFKQPTKVR